MAATKLAATANAVSATKLATARQINGTNFDGTGNITTVNWGTARTLTIGNSGKSVNGGVDVSWSLSEIGAARARGELSSGATENITTDQFVQWLKDSGAFDERVWIARGSWSYANNKTITDTGCGNIHLAGCTIEVISSGEFAYTIRIITPTTTSGDGTTGAEFVYVNNGSAYLPGWRRIYTTAWKPNADDVGALPLIGGTVTGQLNLYGANKQIAFVNQQNYIAMSGDAMYIAANGPTGFIALEGVNNPKVRLNKSSGREDHTIYHTGFKPSPEDAQAFRSVGVTATVDATPGVAWNARSGVYNSKNTGDSDLVAHFFGNGSCPALQIKARYKNGGLWYRSARDGVGFEESWAEIYTTKNKPTAADVGAVNKAGDAMSGGLRIEGRSIAGGLGVKRNGSTQYANFGQSGDTGGEALVGVGSNVDSFDAYLKVGRAGKLNYSDGTGEKKVYHEGYKPTAADVDALPSGGTAVAATKLATARQINGTNFDGTANITTANWGTARTLTIGDAAKSVNGAGNVSWSLDEIGAVKNNAWSAQVKLGIWSAICELQVPGTLGGKAIVTVGHTRNNVVVNAMFLVSFGHSGQASITQLESHGYTQIKVRPAMVGANNIRFEILDDTAALDPMGTVVAYTVRVDNLFGSLYPFTEFTASTGTPQAELSTAWRAIKVNNNKVYHEGFKPTAADVGAL